MSRTPQQQPTNSHHKGEKPSLPLPSSVHRMHRTNVGSCLFAVQTRDNKPNPFSLESQEHANFPHGLVDVQANVKQNVVCSRANFRFKRWTTLPSFARSRVNNPSTIDSTELLRQTWTAFKVSPLFDFSYDEAVQRKYATALAAFVAAVSGALFGAWFTRSPPQTRAALCESCFHAQRRLGSTVFALCGVFPCESMSDWPSLLISGDKERNRGFGE